MGINLRGHFLSYHVVRVQALAQRAQNSIIMYFRHHDIARCSNGAFKRYSKYGTDVKWFSQCT